MGCSPCAIVVYHGGDTANMNGEKNNMKTCQHKGSFEANVNVNRTIEADGSISIFRAFVNVKCSECNIPFKFSNNHEMANEKLTAIIEIRPTLQLKI